MGPHPGQLLWSTPAVTAAMDLSWELVTYDVWWAYSTFLQLTANSPLQGWSNTSSCDERLSKRRTEKTMRLTWAGSLEILSSLLGFLSELERIPLQVDKLHRPKDCGTVASQGTFWRKRPTFPSTTLEFLRRFASGLQSPGLIGWRPRKSLLATPQVFTSCPGARQLPSKPHGKNLPFLLGNPDLPMVPNGADSLNIP